MVELVIVFIVMLVLIALMAVGVIFGREPIKGSCGGVQSECSICGGNPADCSVKSEKQSASGY